MKVVSVKSVIKEIQFQRNQMINYMRDCNIEEDAIILAYEFFDIVIHGIEEHLQHFELDVKRGRLKEM